MDRSPALSGLDAAQHEAVISRARPLAIIASAGSGKTTVLTRRIAHRILTGDAEASHVLALTFTRQAAGELRRRLRRFDLGQQIEAGTFHAIALRLMRDRALASNKPEPRLAPDRIRLLQECIGQLKLTVPAYAAAADLDWARARRIAPSDYFTASRVARRRSAIPAGRFAEFAAEYQQVKRRRGVVDFDDLLEGALTAMSDPAFAQIVHWRFRHFFVDEAQDLNPLQHAVLEAWRGGRPDLCLVGDPRQAIYGWNGADPTLLAQVERSYPGITVVALTSNYRSSPQVVRAAAGVLAERGVLDDSVSEQPDGPPITIKTCADEADEASLIARFVAQQIGSQRPGDIAVLARTNDQLNPIAEQLSAMGIAVERGARRSPLERALAEAYRCQNREVLAVWAETHSADANESLRRVAEAADRYLSSHEPGGFRIWVEVHQPFDDDLDAPALDAVTLASFHAAKGREWPTVVLAGLDAGLVPHASAVSDEQLAEEARLLYVAVTRAQSNLLVTRCEQRNGSLATESPWLAPIRRAGHIDRAVLPPDWIKQIHAAPNPLEPWLTWRAAVARAAGINVASVCSDATLRALHADPPGTIAEFAARIGITARAARAMRPPPIPLS